MAKVFSLVQHVLGAGIYAVQPPVGQDWEITGFGSSAIVGVAPAGVPNLHAGIFNATVAVNGLMRRSSVANPHVAGWWNPASIYVNNANYLQLVNPEAGALDLGANVRLVHSYGSAGVSNIISGTATLIAGGVQAIRPPAGEDWVITGIGSSRWVGAQPAGLPNVEVRITDGTNAALVMAGTDARGWDRPIELYINHTNYLTLTNPAGAGGTVSWSGYKAKTYTPTGTSQVVTAVTVLGAGGIATIRPPLGYEMRVTDIGCSVWVGAPPAGLPSVSVALTDGVIAPIMQNGANNKGWLGRMDKFLSRTNYMTITDAGAGSNVAVSAIMWKA